MKYLNSYYLYLFMIHFFISGCSGSFSGHSATPVVAENNVMYSSSMHEVSLFSDSDTPQVLNSGDNRSVELGVRFYAKEQGLITGIRYFKGPRDRGEHTAHLWTSDGQLLASASFSNETSSGWQLVRFDQPIQIQANRDYIASYHSNGNYAATSLFFQREHASGPLVAPKSNNSRRNGVYRYGNNPRFPNKTYRSTNYHVDVLFADEATPASPEVNLTANPASISIGESSTLTYSSTNTTSCTGNGFSTAGQTSGTVIVSPDQDSNYSISCLGEDGSTISASVVISTSDTTAPSVPQRLAASGLTTSEVQLSWDASNDNVGVNGYEIFKDGQSVAISPTNSHLITGLDDGTTYSFQVLAYDAAGNYSVLSPALSITTFEDSLPPPQDTYTLFSDSDTPSNLGDPDTASVELGVRFSATTSGNIVGIRYYKGAQDIGTHTAHLWSSSGELLASATFMNESNSGWQSVNFAEPVVINAGEEYVASYHSNGRYTATTNYFTESVTSGFLTAPGGNNGVYSYSSGASFPNQSYNSTNYWVDVNFSTSNEPPPPVTVNGMCGSADSQNFSNTPSSNLCAAGTATTVAGSGPWNWDCLGSNGGSNDSCSADMVNIPPHTGQDILPGPSQALFDDNPYYECVHNLYVATPANGGSDSNNGQSATNLGDGVGPFSTIQRANSALPSNASGYCINVGDGVYKIESVINVSKGGRTASITGFVVYRSTSLLGAKLEAQNGANGFFHINAPYVIIEGFELDGNRYSSMGTAIDTCFNGTNYNGVHHVTVMNNYVHDAGNSGIAFCWAEYYRALHNRSDNNAFNSWYSGLSTYQPMAIPNYQPTAYDQQWAPYRNVYAYNSLNGNFTLPQNGPHTDGNGFIYDDTQHAQSAPNVTYPHMALIMGNIATNNGGAGFQVGPTSANAHVFNNTAFNNYLDTVNDGTWRGELSAAFTFNVIFKNNIGFTQSGSGILSSNSPLNVGNPRDASNDFLNNIFYGANVVVYSPETFSSQQNKENTNPLFADWQNGNFALCTGVGVPHSSCSGMSPALGYGAQVPYWHQQTPGQIDVGACPGGAVDCN